MYPFAATHVSVMRADFSIERVNNFVAQHQTYEDGLPHRLDHEQLN